MRALRLLSLLLFFSSPSCKPTGAVPDLCTSTTRSLSYTTFQSIEAALVEQMELAEKDGDVPGSFYKKEVLADVAGGFLRLAFHDACGYDQEADDSFGPDGCFVSIMIAQVFVQYMYINTLFVIIEKNCFCAVTCLVHSNTPRHTRACNRKGRAERKPWQRGFGVCG